MHHTGPTTRKRAKTAGSHSDQMAVLATRPSRARCGGQAEHDHRREPGEGHAAQQGEAAASEKSLDQRRAGDLHAGRRRVLADTAEDVFGADLGSVGDADREVEDLAQLGDVAPLVTQRQQGVAAPVR